MASKDLEPLQRSVMTRCTTFDLTINGPRRETKLTRCVRHVHFKEPRHRVDRVG
jgi:hypothetical protein